MKRFNQKAFDSYIDSIARKNGHNPKSYKRVSQRNIGPRALSYTGVLMYQRKMILSMLNGD